MNKKKIYFWVPYPQRSAPSQRFRVEQYLPYLPQNSFSYTVLSFLDAYTWSILYKKGYRVKKFLGMVMGFFRRIGHLFKSAGADYVFILREAAPVGPPVFEWLLSKIFRKKIIYDFDDAIWIPGGEKMSWRKRFFKSTWKIKYIIHWAYKVSCGNQFLFSYARNYNQNVIILPTGFDTERIKGKQRNETNGKKVIVGWTGSHTTLHNLEEIGQVIPELKKEIDDDKKILLAERGVLVDLAGKKALAERAERNKADPELLDRRQDSLFRFAPPQRIFVLQRGQGLHCMRTANNIDAGLR